MSKDIQTLFGDRLRLGDILPMMRRGWWLVLGSVLLCFVVAALVAGLSTRYYRATSVIRIVPSQGQEVQSKEMLDIDLRGFQEVERFYRTEVQLFKTRSFAMAVAESYNKHHVPGWTLDAEEPVPGQIDFQFVRAQMEVFPQERSQLIEIAFIDADRERAANLAMIAAMEFKDKNLSSRRDLATEANTWIEGRITKIETSRQEAVDSLIGFKRDKNIIDRGDDGGGALEARMAALEDSYGAISAERVLLESRLQSHQALLRKGDYSALAAMPDLPLTAGLLEMHATARTELAGIAARYGPKHPEYVRASGSVERIERQLEAEVREAVRSEKAQLGLLQSQEAQLKAEREGTLERVLEQQQNDAEYRRLLNKVRQLEETHKTLLKRQNELTLTAASQLNNVQLVDIARAPDEGAYIRPRVSLILAAGLVLGALLGVLLALVRGLLDDTVLSPADIENFIRLPLLGVVPHIDPTGHEHPELLVHYEPRSTVAEAFRGVRTMVENRPDGTRPRRLLVTSSAASEGKTSVAVQLATIMAQQGRRVILVEGDHRRPRLHRIFDLDNSQGVTNVLSGEMTFEEAMFPTPVPGLSVLPRGPRAAGSVEQLTTEPMLELLNRLDAAFDTVVIDTPPAAMLADAVTLSSEVDGVVMVVRSGRVSRGMVRHTVARLQQVGATIPGVVVNDFRSSGGKGGYGYGYGYYYNQNYYYDENADEDTPEEGEAAK